MHTHETSPSGSGGVVFPAGNNCTGGGGAADRICKSWVFNHFSWCDSNKKEQNFGGFLHPSSLSEVWPAVLPLIDTHCRVECTFSWFCPCSARIWEGVSAGAPVDPSVSGFLALFKQHLEKRRTAPAEEPPVCLPSITQVDSCCQALRRFSYLSNNISPALKKKRREKLKYW